MNYESPAHFNRAPLRKAEFIQPPNTLKAKVGSGGLSEQILEKAQALLENNAVDFQPLAEIYLNSLAKAIEKAAKTLSREDTETLIATLIYPAMQLKANGGMFHYPLVTRVSDRLVQFLEVVEKLDHDVIEIIMAFHTTIRAIVLGRITGTGGRHGEELMAALDDACMRYFEKYPGNRSDTERYQYDDY